MRKRGKGAKGEGRIAPAEARWPPPAEATPWLRLGPGHGAAARRPKAISQWCKRYRHTAEMAACPVEPQASRPLQLLWRWGDFMALSVYRDKVNALFEGIDATQPKGV